MSAREEAEKALQGFNHRPDFEGATVWALLDVADAIRYHADTTKQVPLEPIVGQVGHVRAGCDATHPSGYHCGLGWGHDGPHVDSQMSTGPQW